MLWEWLFWQARCRAVFPALERGKRREDTLATRFSADQHLAGLAERRHLTDKKEMLTFSASRPAVPEEVSVARVFNLESKQAEESHLS